MISGPRMKMLMSACILALVIGLVLSSRPVTKAPRETEGWRNAYGIDLSFFDFGLKPMQVPAPSAPVPAPHKPADAITAASYLVANLETGQVYFQKDPSSVRPIASISKLITAAVATARMAGSSTILVAPSSVTGYDATSSPATIRPGESFALEDIVRAMLLVSSNDAATAIADAYPDGRAAFVSAMGAFASSLAMAHTSFADPSGLSPMDVSTADDLFKLARYLYKERPDILAITSAAGYDAASTPEHAAHSFPNTDPFIGDPHLIGGKTGRTDSAGETMLTLFRFAAQGADYPVAIIVLHSGQAERQVDSSILVSRTIAAIQGK